VAFLGGKLDVSNSSRNSSLTPPATAMTLAAIFIPDWITWAVDTDDGGHFTRTIGLHRACSSTTGKCVHYPQQEDCSGSDRYFCSMWRSVGFMMSFAAMLELATLVAYVVVILGGKQKREGGWKVLATMLLLVGVVQCASMAIVVGCTFERAVLLLIWSRPTFSTMMRGFSRDGIWTNRGFYARFLGVLRSFRQHLSPCRRLSSRQKMDMNSFPVSVMGGN